MEKWHKTGCVLCAQNCGLEVLVEDGRMVKVRPDKANPRSRGYACRKGLNVLYHQYPADRITRPLKRVGDGFEQISWDRAMEEIAERLQGLLDRHGPRCLAYLGGSSQGGHMEAGFGLGLLRALGSQYYYSSAGQEFSGAWWINGRMLGKQYNVAIPDEHAAEMLVAWGWNGMQSHQMPQAPLVLKAFSKDPRRTLVSMDPRRSETAAIADIHLAVRPGTDALLARAMIALIVQEGWQNQSYLDEHVDGWDRIRSWFENFDIQGALPVCRVEAGQVRELCRLMTTRRWCLHTDLGIYMGRHSTLNSYLTNILAAVCGVFGVRGGNIIPGMVMPMGFHADERNEKIWRTAATGLPPAAAGAFPPAVIPEEIESGRPDRLRAVIVSACNPLRSWPDTRAYEKAFGELDLLVVNDIVMSETARLAHYVLPCRTFYESWDVTFFPWTYPEVFLQLRRPLVEAPGECLEASQILFQALLDSPEGIWVGKADDKNPMDGIKTPSGNVDVFISELEAGVLDLTPEKEARDLEMPAGFPLVLNAGRHMTTNINTMMRNPQWNEGKRACTVAVSPADAADLDLVDGQDVRVTTAAGSAVGELEISEQVRDGMVLVPHGFGLNYDGTVYGINVNQLTLSSHRDPIGTPLHRFVPCRVEGVGG